ncbi:MAG: hypothetical protein GDA36_09620 [Rhodobacteraceae bacterium]|nr:hypothetical protein [Paracoccaceae bacterium]
MFRRVNDADDMPRRGNPVLFCLNKGTLRKAIHAHANGGTAWRASGSGQAWPSQARPL